MQRPGRPARTFRAIGLVLLGSAPAFLAAFLLAAGMPTPVPSEPVSTPPRQWGDIARPLPFFSLDSPEFGKQPSRFAAGRQPSGGGLGGIFAFGRFDGGATPYFQLSLDRVGSETMRPAPFFVELARHAAEAALALTRSDLPRPLATKFGDFEVADVVLARGAVQATCLGFRFYNETIDFSIAGFACGVGKPFDKALLACTLDRLDPISALADGSLGQFVPTGWLERERSCSELAPTHPGPRAEPTTVMRILKSTDRAKKAFR